MDHGSAGSVGLSRRVHDHIRIALICDHYKKLVVCSFQAAFLLFLKSTVLGQKAKLPLSADAAQGSHKGDPRSRNIDLDLLFQSLFYLFPFRRRHYCKLDGLFRCLKSEGVQHLRCRGSPA